MCQNQAVSAKLIFLIWPVMILHFCIRTAFVLRNMLVEYFYRTVYEGFEGEQLKPAYLIFNWSRA